MIKTHELRLFSAFENISEANLEKIAELVEEKSHHINEIIFDSGDKGDYLYFIKKGEVEISIPVKEGKEQSIAVYEAGEFFGEISFLNQDYHSARAKAVEETEVLRLKNNDYERIIREAKREGIELQQQIFLKVICRLRDINRKYSMRPFAA